MSSTHPFPPTHADSEQEAPHGSSVLVQLAQFWLSIATTGFVIGVLLILLVRLQGGTGEAATANDRIVQSLATVLVCTVLLAGLAWNRIAYRAVTARYRFAAVFGALVGLAFSLTFSVETMRRPMDAVVISNPAGDRIVTPSFPAQ